MEKICYDENECSKCERLGNCQFIIVKDELIENDNLISITKDATEGRR